MRISARVSVALSVLLLLVALPPWYGAVNHSHWQRVGWIPFASPPVRVRDILANLVLFIPLGASLSVAFRVMTPGRVAATALALSVLGEWSQVYSHTRFPSATDVVCNVIGAVVAAWATRFTRSREPASSRLGGRPPE